MTSQNGVEMESKILVSTFDETIQAQITIQGDAMLAEEFILIVGQALGLQRSSDKFFGIFQGLLHPTKKFKSIDPVPMNANDLTFQKWCFDSSKESKLLNDPVAVKLVYAQCKAYIQQGLLKPCEDISAKLEESNDPAEIAKYITLCQSITDYNNVHLPHCRLHKTFSLLPDVAPRSIVNLRLFQRGMLLGVTKGDCGEEEEYFVSWRKIQKWRKSEEDDTLVTYDVYSVPSEDYSCLFIHTEQANYLMSATIEMIKGLQSELNGPIFKTCDLKRNKQREVIEWNNIVYSENRFTAEREIAEYYAEVSMLR